MLYYFYFFWTLDILPSPSTCNPLPSTLDQKADSNCELKNIEGQTGCRPRMTIPRDTHLLYSPPWKPVMHLDWTISSHQCSSAAEIFHFRLIRIHSNARNSITSGGCLQFPKRFSGKLLFLLTSNRHFR